MASEPTASEALSSALELILPATFLHSTQRSTNRLSELCPEEQLAARPKHGARLQEFTTARAMAHQLLTILAPLDATTRTALLSDAEGSPTWPHGYTGSISHTKGICSVVVGKKQSPATAVGIDIETLGRLSVEAKRRIATSSEQTLIESWAKQNALSEQDAYTMIFSAKEAFFKYQFPSTGIWLEFQDVEVTHLHDHSIEVRSVKLTPQNTLPSERTVFFAYTRKHVVTTVWN